MVGRRHGAVSSLGDVVRPFPVMTPPTGALLERLLPVEPGVEPFSGLLPRVRLLGTSLPIHLLGQCEVGRGVKIGRPPVGTEVDDSVVQASDRPKG